MTVSSVSQLPVVPSPAAQRPQGAPAPAAADNDGDTDDHGGPPDVDSTSSGRLDIKA